ncbi:peptide/nickel transport system permease protein [Paenarthrobacter nicotinovorans]|uniref:dipeptide/oligopeptide/nickel ABC transporter permease/ATP-binding protein n=1 Tax=Micrococcaceae TaxID=1268 RepID=UPI0008771ADA|nr:MULTISPECIES: dipeptide/oligopeptide/nickel ABC transporter permease/ATP-binding protein [Micrococcaceae]MDR6436626.1 peptide/nickel transport system permease protein [Paenarthrobacter nicotinovorans]SCZ57100.1 peptide/nickel transport system permease protein [Arthrobacter sp. UNCCL28]
MSIEELSVDPGLASPPRKSPLRKLAKDPQAIITSVLLLAIIILGLLTPLIAPHDPNEAQLNAINATPGTPGYILGADQNGRDIASRLLHSIGTSLIAGLIGASVALTIGITFGLIGGYYGRKLRSATEWVFSLIMTFPGLLLLIVLMPVTKGDYRATMLIFGVLLSPGVYRIVRNLVLGVKNELYVDAARVSGLSNLRILGRHVLFAVRGPIIVATAFLIGSAISLQSGLAFLGVGSTLVPSFGAMIADGFTNLYVDPTQFIWPSVMLGTLTASLVLLGNSLRDAFEGVRLTPVKARAAQAGRTPAKDAVQGSTTDLLSVRDLGIAYPTPSGELKEVVKGVELTLQAGETLGLVGESGSGKTQTAFAILGVLPPEAVVTHGWAQLAGRNLIGLSEREFRTLRGRDIAYIPQEPMSNLDPSYTVGAQLVEGIRASAQMSRREAKATVMDLLVRVGIEHPERTFHSYPHQISGGMAQRVLIAGAVASRPKLLIADEPTTALDVTVQAEILDLIRDLQAEMGMAVLLVTHNFGVVADICDRISVMQDGRVVESGTALELFREPQHPYTQMLLGSILDEHTVRTDQPISVSAAIPGSN